MPEDSTHKYNAEETMDYFMGHFVPACWFLSTGTWWAINEFRVYTRSQHGAGKAYRARVWYPGPCFRRFPVESLARLLIMVAGAVNQTYSCCYVKQDYIHPERMQHAVIFLAFGLSGAIDVAAAVARKRFPLPPGAVRAGAVLAYLIVMLVFVLHAGNGGRSLLEHHLHLYFQYAAATMVAVHLAEAATHGRHLALALTRAYLQVFMGALALQIGFTLFMPLQLSSRWWSHPWAEDENNSVATASAVVCSHMLVTFVLLLVLGAIVRRSQMARLRQTTLTDDADNKVPLLLTNGTNRHV